MKKTAYICLLVFIGSLFGCVDKFEEVNTNGNKMYEAELPNIFAGTVYRTMNTVADCPVVRNNGLALHEHFTRRLKYCSLMKPLLLWITRRNRKLIMLWKCFHESIVN